VGTPAVYLMGALEDRPGGVKFFSLGSFLTKTVHVLEFLDLPSTKAGLDLHLDHWRLSRRRVPLRESVWKLLAGLTGRSILTDDRLDTAPHCATPPYMFHVNETFTVQHRPCFYTSYTTSHPAVNRATPLVHSLLRHVYPLIPRSVASLFVLPSLSIPFAICHRLMLNYTGGKAVENLTKGGLTVSDWHENDGVVPTISQGHPFVCTVCQERGRRRRGRDPHTGSITEALAAVVPLPTTDSGEGTGDETGKRPMSPGLPDAVAPPSSSPVADCFHSTLTIDAVAYGCGEKTTVRECEWERGERRPLLEDGLAACEAQMSASAVPPPTIAESQGTWVSFDVSDATHAGLVLQPSSLAFQRAFFSHLWARIDAIDRHMETGARQQQKDHTSRGNPPEKLK
jgi:hypothetical protein